MTVNGKERKKSTGFKDLESAKRRKAELEVEFRSESLGWTPKKVVTFAEWRETYSKSYSVRKKRPERDRQMFAHAAPIFDSKPMDKIGVADCEAYMAKRAAEGAHPSTVRRERGFLCAVWNRAVEDSDSTGVMKNPWTKVKPPKIHARSRTITFDEQAALMEHSNEEYRRLMTVLFGTGLRSNELLNLRYRDVKGDEIHVRWETAKCDKERGIPLLPEVAQAIKGQAEARGLTKFDDKPLFKKTDWAVLKTINAAARRANDAVKKRGERPVITEHIRTHDFRRTFATRCAVAGMPINQLAQILGHSSAAITEKYYIHLKARDKQVAMQAVAGSLGLAIQGEALVANSASV